MTRMRKLSAGERIIGMGIIGTSRRVDAIVYSNFGGYKMRRRR